MNMASTALRQKVNPILPDKEWDLGDKVVDPHPDGRAWLKACEECAGRLSDPQQLGDRYQRELMTAGGGRDFYCIHRDDAGKHRICACYAALNSL